jgi:hypothetical protein
MLKLDITSLKNYFGEEKMKPGQNYLHINSTDVAWRCVFAKENTFVLIPVYRKTTQMAGIPLEEAKEYVISDKDLKNWKEET